MTPKQAKDMKSIKYFIPIRMRHIKITDEDIEEFLLLSERGAGTDKRGKFVSTALAQGKRWREWHMREYETGIDSTEMPLYMLLGGCEGSRSKYNPVSWFYGRVYDIPIPREVVDYMKKSMYKGTFAERIERVYQELHNHMGSKLKMADDWEDFFSILLEELTKHVRRLGGMIRNW